MKTNSKTTFFMSTALIVSSFLFTQCDSGDEFENASNNEIKVDISGEILQGNQRTLIIDETNPSNSYTRVDSITQYGLDMHYVLPDSLKDCGLKVIVSGKMRETESMSGYIAIALHGKDTIYFWGQLLSRAYIKEPNKWFDFKDSVVINKATNTPATLFLNVFPFKQFGKGFYDVDNLVVRISRE